MFSSLIHDTHQWWWRRWRIRDQLMRRSGWRRRPQDQQDPCVLVANGGQQNGSGDDDDDDAVVRRRWRRCCRCRRMWPRSKAVISNMTAAHVWRSRVEWHCCCRRRRRRRSTRGDFPRRDLGKWRSFARARRRIFDPVHRRGRRRTADATASATAPIAAYSLEISLKNPSVLSSLYYIPYTLSQLVSIPSVEYTM